MQGTGGDGAAKKHDSRRIYTRVFWFVVTALPLAGVLLSVFNPTTYEVQQHWFREYATRHPVLGPFAFIALQALQVVFTPINHYVVGYLGGFLYGTLRGSLYNYSGRLIGHTLAFWLARRYGRRLAERFVRPASLARFDSVAVRSSFLLFLAYFLPLFPDDELSYLAGLSKMPTRQWALANAFGQIGGSIGLAYLGSGVSATDPLLWAFVITLPAFTLMYIWLQRRSLRRTQVPSSGNPEEGNG